MSRTHVTRDLRRVQRWTAPRFRLDRPGDSLGNLHAAKVEFINKRIGLGNAGVGFCEALRYTHTGLQLGRDVGRHVLAVCVAPRERESEVPVPIKSELLEEKVDVLFKQAIGAQ